MLHRELLEVVALYGVRHARIANVQSIVNNKLSHAAEKNTALFFSSSKK